MRHLRSHKNKMGFLSSVNIDSSQYSIKDLRGGLKRWILFTRGQSVLGNRGVVLRILGVRRGLRGGVEVVFQLVIGNTLGPVAVYWISSIHDILLELIIDYWRSRLLKWRNPLYWIVIIGLSPVWMYGILWKWLRRID